MSKFNIGDLVVLKSGSMRMCVEECSDEAVSCVWCNDGVIGRDTFNEALMNKWEYREESSRGGDRGHGGGKPYRGGGDRDWGGDRGGDRGSDDRPPRKTGWDGKPRDKKYFRKDDK